MLPTDRPTSSIGGTHEAKQNVDLWAVQVATLFAAHTMKSVYSHTQQLYNVAQNYDEAGFGLLGGDTLRHCIVDNFDAEISSPNCKVCVHCLAMIMAQVPLTSNFGPEELRSGK